MNENPGVFHDSAWAMGTRLDVVLTGIPRDAAATLCEQVFARIHELESIMSRFQPDGETGRLNLLAATAPVGVSPFLWRLLGECFRFHRETGGAFDITLAPLLSWHRLPADERTENARLEARAASGMDRLVLDPVNHTVRFHHALTGIDFGAVGKGLALDEIRPLLTGAGVENALVSFGESSVLALGRHPHGDCWEIGVRHPATDETARVIRLRDAVLSVSGLRRMTHGSVSDLQGHIVEPSTGLLAGRALTVAVKASSGFEAEVLSTAWIASGKDTPAFLKNFPGAEGFALDA